MKLQPALSFALVLAAGLAIGAASASVAQLVRHVELDPATSIAAYESSALVFEPDPVTGFFISRWDVTRIQTRLSGSFDLLLTTYVWDQDYLGNPVTDPSSSTWVSFQNPNLVALDASLLVDLTLSALLTGDSFAGNNGACSFPQSPWTYCSGLNNGPLSSISGSISGTQLLLNGVFPTGGGFFSSSATTTYSITGILDSAREASGVPSPAPLLLVVPALAALSALARRRVRAVVNLNTRHQHV